MTTEHWYLFPISIGIATTAMTTGIGGAVFFSPIFLLWLRLEPSVAIGTALFTELFGFTSGLVAYVRSGRIDYRLGVGLLVFSIPGALVGVLLADHIPGDVLKAIFAAGLLFLGSQIISAWRRRHGADPTDFSEPPATRIVDRNGNVFEYSVRNKVPARILAGVGGTFLGMISVGLAELVEYELVVRRHVPSQVAVATSIFLVVCTVFVAVVGHGYAFASVAGPEDFERVLGIACFTVPGVIVGGQIGPRVGGRLDPEVLKAVIGVLFVTVGALMLAALAL